MHNNIEPTFREIILNYYTSSQNDIFENHIFDELRQKKMNEIGASLLISSITQKDKTQTNSICKYFINSCNKFYPAGWEEKPYGIEDIDHGSYGTVTTMICAYSILEAVQSNLLEKSIKEKSILILHKIFDSIYFLENKGYIKKNLINKSKVFNTDLLAAFVSSEYIKLINKNSVRWRLFNEMSLRCVNRTISHQLPNGAFRYHDLSLGIPILYQAMCSSLLFSLSSNIKHPFIYESARKGAKYFLKFYNLNSFKIDWDKANCYDKSGSIWIYGWIPTILENMKLEKYANNLISHLLESQSKDGILIPSKIDKNLSVTKDKFYTAMLLTSFVMSKKSITKNKSSKIYVFLNNLIFSIVGSFNFLRCINSQVFRKTKNLLYPSGALENEEW